MDDDCTLTTRQIAERFRRQDGSAPYPSTITRLLRRNSFSPRVPARAASAQSELQLAEFQVNLESLYTRDPAQLIFLDETAITSKSVQQQRVWGRVGERTVVQQIVPLSMPRISVLGAYTVGGFIAAVATKGTFVRHGEVSLVPLQRFGSPCRSVAGRAIAAGA